MTTSKWTEIVGIIGAALLLLMFSINSAGDISINNVWYELLNFMGGTLLAISLAAKKAWPGLALNVIWAIVALIWTLTLI